MASDQPLRPKIRSEMKLRALAMYRSRNVSSVFTALSYQPKPGTGAGYSYAAYVVDPPAKHVDCWLTFPPSFAFSAPDLRDFIMAGFKVWVFEPETQEGFALTCAVCDYTLYPAGSAGQYHYTTKDWQDLRPVFCTTGCFFALCKRLQCGKCRSKCVLFLAFKLLSASIQAYPGSCIACLAFAFTGSQSYHAVHVHELRSVAIDDWLSAAAEHFSTLHPGCLKKIPLHIQNQCPIKIETASNYMKGKLMSKKLWDMTNHFVANRVMLATMAKIVNQHYFNEFWDKNSRWSVACGQ